RRAESLRPLAQDPVAARTTPEAVAAWASGKHVAARATYEAVAPASTIEPVPARAPVEPIVAGAAEQHIAAAPAEDSVPPGPAAVHVATAEAVDHVVAAAPVDHVRAPGAADQVASIGAPSRHLLPGAPALAFHGPALGLRHVRERPVVALGLQVLGVDPRPIEPTYPLRMHRVPLTDLQRVIEQEVAHHRSKARFVVQKAAGEWLLVIGRPDLNPHDGPGGLRQVQRDRDAHGVGNRLSGPVAGCDRVRFLSAHAFGPAPAPDRIAERLHQDGLR